MWPRLLSATAKLGPPRLPRSIIDRKSTRLNSSHSSISYAVFCLNETSTTDISTLSLHDALPICVHRRGEGGAVAAAEIDHPALRRPRERVVREIAGGGTVADDVAAAAQRHGEARATEATEVYHRSEEHTSELQSQFHLVCRLLLERDVHHRHLHSFPTRRSSDLCSPPRRRWSCRGRRDRSSRPPASTRARGP